MAITLDGTITTVEGNGSHPTIAHTVPSTADMLVVRYAQYAASVNACTWRASESITERVSSALSSASDRATCRSLVSPTPDTANVTGTFSTVSEYVIGVAAYRGTNVSDPYGNSNSAVGSGVTPSTTVTTVADQLVVGCTAMYDNGPITEGNIFEYEEENGAALESSAGARVLASGSSTVLSWTTTLADPWAVAAFALKPAAGASGKLHTLTLLGVS